MQIYSVSKFRHGFRIRYLFNRVFFFKLSVAKNWLLQEYSFSIKSKHPRIINSLNLLKIRLFLTHFFSVIIYCTVHSVFINIKLSAICGYNKMHNSIKIYTRVTNNNENFSFENVFLLES